MLEGLARFVFERLAEPDELNPVVCESRGLGVFRTDGASVKEPERDGQMLGEAELLGLEVTEKLGVERPLKEGQGEADERKVIEPNEKLPWLVADEPRELETLTLGEVLRKSEEEPASEGVEVVTMDFESTWEVV